ncbi:MAG: DASS family sodium-coupled anion symporter [Gammaproteobacteria bacterium]
MLKNVIQKIFSTLQQWFSLALGPALGLLTYLLLPETYINTQGADIPFSLEGRITAAIAVWMAFWWLTEAISIYMTALLPVILLPLFGAVPIKQAAAPYAHYLIFLFLGGFMISLAMQKWGLHKRIALRTLKLVGSKPINIIAGFMLTTAGLSMWVSNTATTIMMTPIALSLLSLIISESPDQNDNNLLKIKNNFSLCLLLGIAYSASIGGIGTLIGTPPNLFLASYIKETFDHEISFVQWLGVGLPIVIIFLPISWWLLTRWIYPFEGLEIEGADNLAAEEYKKLGAMNSGEKLTLAVFLMAVFFWIFRPLIQEFSIADLQPFSGLTDSGIAMLAALALFTLPVDIKKREFVMDWESCRDLPWGILILFGGGLSLASAIDQNGVGEFIGYQVAGFEGVHVFIMILAVCTLIIFMTEMTSNIATTATMLPILAAIGPMLGVHAYALIVTAAVSASCAFMMPVATAPNAIVFSSGRITIPQMCKAGFVLNILGIFLISLLMYFIALPLLGVSLK